MPVAVRRDDSPSEYPAVSNLGTYVVNVGDNGQKAYVSDLINPSVSR